MKLVISNLDNCIRNTRSIIWYLVGLFDLALNMTHLLLDLALGLHRRILLGNLASIEYRVSSQHGRLELSNDLLLLFQQVRETRLERESDLISPKFGKSFA